MVQGRCLCGGVVFEVSAPLGFVTHCHCSICRKFHGTPFATLGVVPHDRLRWITGRELVRKYQSSDEGERPFCSRCGSNVPADHHPGGAFIPLGNLDGDVDVKPLAHIFVASKAPWHEITDALPCFDEFPPGFEATAMPDAPRDPAPAGTVGGSCLCNAVAYEIEGGIAFARNCHCSRCRRARSAAFASNGFADSSRIRFTRGEDRLESWKVPEADRFAQTFCRTCGSAMPRVLQNRPFVVIPMGSVDGDPGMRPREHIFVASKARWHPITDSLPQYDEYGPV
jgi:hypothetical protein